jgi:hypothetical protein
LGRKNLWYLADGKGRRRVKHGAVSAIEAYCNLAGTRMSPIGVIGGGAHDAHLGDLGGGEVNRREEGRNVRLLASNVSSREAAAGS